ncbi:tetratricopeptide repeat protein [Pseudodesulfovibrio sp. zrk46]|uniref:tetratricopeptide repeat protein n=1 Tax=Pseudodesulfovibrio sp. zrk46 TaxID=2725288 RepID=UPI001449CD79|nr:tetratricopeptide repeat protein [Pseudodesulfovibrio sp. zrk46]QJB57727.1 tetratricopeptide repeat protein [Pseudodesulfovibrio sp. zrk46]
MKKTIHIGFIPLLCTIFLFATTAFAQKQTLKFEEWLQKYGAWDQLEKEYSQEQDKDAPETILKRVKVYLNLNSPKEALEIVEMTPTFDDNATEANRLWLGGQAHRALGDLTKSVLWFTQAASHVENSNELSTLFRSEPGLEEIWKDVWLRMYWAHTANYSLSRDAQHGALAKIADIGMKVWGDKYWQKTVSIMNQDNSEESPSPIPPTQLNENGQPIQPFISQADTDLIVRALAATSLEKFKEAHQFVSEIQQAPVRFFWITVIQFIEDGQLPESLTPLIDSNYLKASAFWQGNLLAPYSTSRTSWLLGNPDSGPWTKFRNNILSMTPGEAAKSINNELGSMLISEQTATLLNNFKLALSLFTGDFINASSTWGQLEKRNLPLALQLAGIIQFKDSLNIVLPTEPSKSYVISPIFTALSGAAGHNITGNDEAPFWISAPQDKLIRLSQREYPIDKLLLLAYWQQQFDTKASPDLAKRAAYLFNGTAFGNESLLYLANHAVKSKHLQLGAFYLNSVKSDDLDKFNKMIWLDIKTRLELDAGRNASALTTFKKMHELGVDIPVMTRLRMALLFQQRRDFGAAKEQLLAMWSNKATMTTTLQAETLFWLGEGEQAQQNTEEALDYYLKLAWQYPQENIWALTAMYRASLIYEKRGKYDTAKRLLTTVVKRADRKEQREAAKARINAIDKKMGKPSSNQSSALVYPF